MKMSVTAVLWLSIFALATSAGAWGTQQTSSGDGAPAGGWDSRSGPEGGRSNLAGTADDSGSITVTTISLGQSQEWLTGSEFVGLELGQTGVIDDGDSLDSLITLGGSETWTIDSSGNPSLETVPELTSGAGVFSAETGSDDGTLLLGNPSSASLVTYSGSVTILSDPTLGLINPTSESKALAVADTTGPQLGSTTLGSTPGALSVPEPSSWVELLLGVGVLAGFARRSKIARG